MQTALLNRSSQLALPGEPQSGIGQYSVQVVEPYESSKGEAQPRLVPVPQMKYSHVEWDSLQLSYQL